MAIICIESCQCRNCKHYRKDEEEEGRMACFLMKDLLAEGGEAALLKYNIMVQERMMKAK